jgi:hypothetical protein
MIATGMLIVMYLFIVELPAGLEPATRGNLPRTLGEYKSPSLPLSYGSKTATNHFVEIHTTKNGPE